jgi:hypothetical protein
MTIAIFLILAFATLFGIQRSWGPGIHLDLALRVLGNKGRKLPNETRKLLEENKEDFFYGNIAADIIHFKSYGGARGACHQWEVLKKLDNVIEKDSEKAFVFGYGSHLAADTVSHNHFVPYHLCRYPRYGGLGHMYWELSADQDASPLVWDWIQQLQTISRLSSHDQLIGKAVPKRVFSMAVNKQLFNHFILAGGKERWRKGMNLVRRQNIGRLEPSRLDRFRREALRRILFYLQNGVTVPLSQMDPSGKKALKEAILMRKELRKSLKNGRPMRKKELEDTAKKHAMHFLPS